MGFIHIGFIDILDIFLVAFLFYQLYMVLRGTVAINIFGVILVLYFFWLMVKALNMHLLSTILGHVMGVGVIALLIVFQQEVRRFLLILGTKYGDFKFSFERIINRIAGEEKITVPVEEIVEACDYMSKRRIGALIVIAQKSDLNTIAETGTPIGAKITAQLLETIFFKNSPLHDGAVIIKGDKIVAAGCILPVTERLDLPKEYGLRHRAAIGLTESTDAFAIVISEERGSISYAQLGELYSNISIERLTIVLKEKFG